MNVARVDLLYFTTNRQSKMMVVMDYVLHLKIFTILVKIKLTSLNKYYGCNNRETTMIKEINDLLSFGGILGLLISILILLLTAYAVTLTGMFISIFLPRVKDNRELRTLKQDSRFLSK
jgi:hypothetical protein